MHQASGETGTNATWDLEPKLRDSLFRVGPTLKELHTFKFGVSLLEVKFPMTDWPSGLTHTTCPVSGEQRVGASTDRPTGIYDKGESSPKQIQGPVARRRRMDAGLQLPRQSP